MNRIAVSILALGFSFASILCWGAGPNAEQAKAIAQIKKLGGKVVIDEKSPDKPVISVHLRSSQITDTGLIILEGLTTLQSLSLWDTKITNAGLRISKG